MAKNTPVAVIVCLLSLFLDSSEKTNAAVSKFVCGKPDFVVSMSSRVTRLQTAIYFYLSGLVLDRRIDGSGPK